jgi:hypothetical protein
MSAEEARSGLAGWQRRQLSRAPGEDVGKLEGRSRYKFRVGEATTNAMRRDFGANLSYSLFVVAICLAILQTSMIPFFLISWP